MAKFEYTPEITAEITEAYTKEREAGKLNADILADLAGVYEGMTVPSLRGKLMIEDVYVKDTDAEKEILAERRGKEKAAKPKGERVTKATVAMGIVKNLGLPTSLATDLAKAKMDTLKALLVATAPEVEEAPAE